MSPSARTTGPWPGSGTGLLAVLGHPVAHSLSPVMHNAALAAEDLDLAYVAIDVHPDRLDDALAGLAALGFVGCNVTVPHKRTVLAACSSLGPEARTIGAVNTVVVTPDGLHGDNTDGAGFLEGLPADLPAGTAVVFGAGGAARAVVVTLARRGWEVAVVARRGDQAVDLARDLAGPSRAVAGFGLDRLTELVGTADLVVNATPLGLHHEPLPAPLMGLHGGQVAYDLVYNPPDTPFLTAARAAGAVAVDGLAMLVGQAAVAFETWTGRPADRDVMRAAVRRALAAGA